MIEQPQPTNTHAIRQRIEACARALDTTLGPSTQDQLVHWLDCIRSWNKKIDLTAARSLDDLVDLCIADACVLSRDIDLGMRVVDVGAGAGAPGLALAILRPDLAVTLVEPLAKRVSFLRTVIGGLGLDATVQRVRGEQIDREGWDVALSRATLDPASWLALGSQLVVAGGTVAVLLARQDPPEHDGLHTRHDIAYRWPLTHAPRRLQWYRRPQGAADNAIVG